MCLKKIPRAGAGCAQDEPFMPQFGQAHKAFLGKRIFVRYRDYKVIRVEQYRIEAVCAEAAVNDRQIYRPGLKHVMQRRTAL